MIIKSIKAQLKPNNEQKTKLHQSAGVARWAYNWALSVQEENYRNGGKFIYDNDLRKTLTVMKKVESLKWLNDCSNNITKQAVKDACRAYKNMFKGLASKPRFKSKRKNRPSFYHDTHTIKFTEKFVQLEKMGKVKLAEFGRIPVNAKYTNPRITFDGLGWWISVGIEYENQILDKPASEPIGIDVGIKELAVVSNGKIYKNINKTKVARKSKKRLKRLQKKASRGYENLKKKGGESCYKSKRLLKLENKINKTYKRLTNVRTNYIHQTTTKPEYIVIEDLNVKGMMKNKHLSKAIAEQCLSEFSRQIQYKSSWYSIPLYLADRWYPSSKLCSSCGSIKKDLKLSDRIYSCECGLVEDRDVNAGINLSNYPRNMLAI